MPTAQVIDHFLHPRNVGELAVPAITVEVSNPVCGDVLRLSVLLEGGRVIAVGYKTRGCTASIAAGSCLTELVRLRTRVELGQLRAADVDEALGGLTAESKHAAVLCMDAVRKVLHDFPCD